MQWISCTIQWKVYGIIHFRLGWDCLRASDLQALRMDSFISVRALRIDSLIPV